MSLLGLVIPFILRESLFRSLSVPVTLFILCKSLFRSLSVLVIPFILRESLFRSLSVYTLKSTQQTHRTKVSSLKSQISTISNHSYLVIPFILSESLFMSLLGLVIPFILRESLFRSLSVPVILFILCKSLFRSLSVSQYKPSQVSTNPNHGHGHLVIWNNKTTAVTAFRSWSCGHELKVMSPALHHSTILTSQAHCSSRKMRNKQIKQVNGNGKNSLQISHWNLGSKKWTNKRNQIQAYVDTVNPDVMFISEANLDEMTPLHESLITGFDITLPKTVQINGTARLVMLTKVDLEFELMENLMDDIVSSIWIKISRQGVKGLLVCGVYREHQYLSQLSDWSHQPAEQCRRWSNFLRQVETARISAICHIIGDVNLDYKRWQAPDVAHSQMINETKDVLEAGGFHQLVKEVTRSWPGQLDSLIDHFWTNVPQKILSVSNSVRAVADHNAISATVRIKGSDLKRLDTRRRSYKNFDPAIYRYKL